MTYGAEYRLREWPADLFSAEARGIAAARDPQLRAAQAEHLVKEVFTGAAPGRELVPARAGVPISDWGDFRGRPAPTVIDPPRHGNVRVRAGRGFGSAAAVGQGRPRVPDGPSLQRDWITLVDKLDSDGYFDAVVRSPCADGISDRERSEVMSAHILEETGLSVSWPLAPSVGGWSDDVFFTLVEALHDMVARPRTASFHDFGQDWHYGDFSTGTGQDLYRHRVNKLFRNGPHDLALADSGPHRGLLERRPRDGLTSLADAVLSRTDDQSSSPDGVVSRATAKFLQRDADWLEKRSACILLAGELERVRESIRVRLLSRDEGMLFQIANQFAIRHQRVDQHDDCTDEYLDWVFWTFLATYELMRSLAAREG